MRRPFWFAVALLYSCCKEPRRTASLNYPKLHLRAESYTVTPMSIARVVRHSQPSSRRNNNNWTRRATRVPSCAVSRAPGPSAAGVSRQNASHDNHVLMSFTTSQSANIPQRALQRHHETAQASRMQNVCFPPAFENDSELIPRARTKSRRPRRICDDDRRSIPRDTSSRAIGWSDRRSDRKVFYK